MKRLSELINFDMIQELGVKSSVSAELTTIEICIIKSGIKGQSYFVEEISVT